MVRRSALAGAALLAARLQDPHRGPRPRAHRPHRARSATCSASAPRARARSPARLYLEYLRHLVRLRLALLPARFPKFAAVGLSGVFVDMLCLWLLKDRLGWALTPAKLLAAELAVVNNFLWNDLWTFGDLAEQQGYGVARLKRLGKFNAICLAGLALSVALLTMQVQLFEVNPYVANAVAIVATTGWNFWMNKIFSWASPERLAVAAPQRRAASA